MIAKLVELQKTQLKTLGIKVIELQQIKPKDPVALNLFTQGFGRSY